MEHHLAPFPAPYPYPTPQCDATTDGYGTSFGCVDIPAGDTYIEVSVPNSPKTYKYTMTKDVTRYTLLLTRQDVPIVSPSPPPLPPSPPMPPFSPAQTAVVYTRHGSQV